MNLKTRYNLWKTKRFATPSHVFKRKLQKKLEVVLADKYQTKIFWFQTKIFKFTIVGMIVLLLTGSFGTGAYAYYSPEVTEGSVLYPVKNTLEKIEEKTKRTPEAQAKFYLKQLQRREAEKKRVEEKNKIRENLEMQIEKIGEKLDQINTKLQNQELKDKNLKPQIEQRLQERKTKLEEKQKRFENKKQEIEQKVQEKTQKDLQNRERQRIN
ncbi:MAG TPA: hypothetical protein P5230_01060 [Candidatus Magasanikbacteria bacterium]|nr:hypothetical protein [Candidatus Magasanikbacteria bacterium]